MPELTFSFDAPLEANHVSSEDTQAQLDEFRQMPWIKPDYKAATLDALRKVERYWHRYCTHIHADHKAALLSEESSMYMNFIDWMARTSRKKKKKTYSDYWKLLCICFSLLAQRQMSGNVLEQMRRYINTRLRADHSVGVRPKPKHTMSPQDLGVLLRQLWLYTRLAPLGRQLVQMAFVLLCCSFTGTRPRILVPPNSIAITLEDLEAGQGERQEAELAKKRRKTLDDFRSYIPKYIRYDDLPPALCYGDIDLFVIRNPEGGSDVVVTVIDFRNLKGTEQGAEGTKFMMHCDYQLAYCPITYILALAHADRAFKNDRLTPEYILQLRVPERLRTLSIPWKDEMLGVPLLRHIENTPYGPRVHSEKPMKYDTSNTLMKQLGRDAGYDIPIDHYAFRRWTANEANRAFTDQERNRILGHSGTWIFEQYYNDHFIHRDVQSVVLLRPPQAELIRAVAQMSRKRDPNAPKDLTDAQRQMLCRDPHLTNLRRQREALSREIRFGGKSLSSARGTEMYQRHSELGKVISRRRQELRRKGWDQVKEAYHSAMPVLEIDKQIDAMMGVDSGDVAAAELEDDWTPPAPSFWCQEHERVADALFGPTAEMLTGKEALSRRIQVISDLVALCGLREPSRRGPKMDKIDWSQFEEPIDLDDLEGSTTGSADEAKSEDSFQTDELTFPTDQCIFCAGDVTLRTFHPRTKQRPDSLRRHVENQHLLLFSRTDPVSCPHRVCSDTGVPTFPNREVWLNHAAIVHQYDLKIQLHRLASIL